MFRCISDKIAEVQYKQFKLIVIETLDEHCYSGLHTLRFRVLHVVVRTWRVLLRCCAGFITL